MPRGAIPDGCCTYTAGAASIVAAAKVHLVGAVIAVGFWLWMARSLGRRHRWVRIVCAAFFGLNMFGLLKGLRHGSAVTAQPDLAVAIVLCIVELAAVVHLFRMKTTASQPRTSRVPPEA